MYDKIFFTNVLRIMAERKMSNSELHKLSGVSASFLSDLTSGKGNPSIRTMEAISNALSIPLPLMLEHVESEIWALLTDSALKIEELPQGFERVGAILPEHKAFQVKEWDRKARAEIKKLKKSK
ncbi:MULTISPECIES: helix-turn-helix domain-containing protein [Pseudoalteromonas]|uniref:helix-turn-helix domain-containing protein n=1 Tax=Pseudoalteromonas TaxID=53246 RepID=UPI001EF608AE|nr:helix-turn-helix domain-containing protein [Pseudoalteromonas sp. Of11M-6]MCG7556243.1 helix-turn-helix domain-containing protein [Pseudoalteromonas sp. Of11M-6]